MLSKHTSVNQQIHNSPRRRVDLACDLSAEVVDKRPGALGQRDELGGLAQESRGREHDTVGCL